MGPLSAKQHREYLKLEAEEQRKNAAFTQEQQRKEQLHKLKLQEAAAKASQGIAHKEQNQAVKLAEGTAKVPRINRQKLGLPSMNPLANTEVLGPGQKRLPGMVPSGTDTVPAMLTPGEAVIPAPAAQDPKNKKAIKRMVNEGRKANKQNKGVLGFEDGTTVVPSLAYAHYDEPGSSFMNGTTGVQYYNDGTVTARRPGWQVSDQSLGNNTPVQWIPPSEIGPAFVPPRTGRGFYKEPTPAYELPVPTTLAQFAGQEPIPRVAINADVLLTPAQERQRSVVASKPNEPMYVPPANVYDVPPVTSYKPIDKEGKQSSYLTLAERNNNPGNLVFANQTGAVRGDKRPDGTYWAVFESPEAGRLALENQIKLDTQSRGMSLIDTMNKYAPAADKNNPSAYAQTIANKLGIKVTDKVPEDKIGLMADAITTVESGGKYGRKGINDPRVIKTPINPVADMPEQQVIEVPLPGEETKETLSLVQSDPETANRAIANVAFENEGSLAKLIPEAAKQEDPQGFLAKAVESLFGDKGLFNTQELARFALVAAGGMAIGYNPGLSLRYAARDVLATADRRASEEFRAKQQQKQFEQQEAMLDKRFEKEMNIRRDDAKRAEDKQLESEMIKEGRDAVAVRNWIKSGQEGEPPAIKTSSIRNGKSELMTVTQPIKIGNQVFKPGQPVWVYEMVQQTGTRKGETVQMARIGDKDVPTDYLMGQGMFLDKWDSGKYGDMAKLKRAQDFADRVSEKKIEPIITQAFGASNVKGRPNTAREGVITAGAVSSQLESYFRNKVNLDDRATQVEVEKIGMIAAEQMASDIKNGTFKSVNDITPYFAAGEFRERAKISDKLITLDKKSNKLMSVDDVLAMRNAVQVAMPKSSPDLEIERLAQVWSDNKNNLQNRYKDSDRNTGFALFVLDFAKQAQNKK